MTLASVLVGISGIPSVCEISLSNSSWLVSLVSSAQAGAGRSKVRGGHCGGSHRGWFAFVLGVAAGAHASLANRACVSP